MRRVIVESPYAGASTWRLVAAWQRWRNVRYARLCVRDALGRGEAPLASHLLYTQPGILRDGVAEERARGIAAGLAWLPGGKASVVYVDRGISAGMRQGITAAHEARRPVYLRSLWGWGFIPAGGEFRLPAGQMPPPRDATIIRVDDLPPMTEAELAAQRRSFAYGNCAIGNPAVTRELVAKVDAALRGEPPHAGTSGRR